MFLHNNSSYATQELRHWRIESRLETLSNYLYVNFSDATDTNPLSLSEQT